MTAAQETWAYLVDITHGNYDVECYRTVHHSSTQDGIPWGMEFEVAHNKEKDIFIRITPGSGSHRDIITKEEADQLLKDGKKLIWQSKKDHGVNYYQDNGTIRFHMPIK